MSQIRQSYDEPTVIEVVNYEHTKDAVVQGPPMSRCKVLIIFWAVIIGLLIVAGVVIVILFAVSKSS